MEHGTQRWTTHGRAATAVLLVGAGLGLLAAQAAGGGPFLRAWWPLLVLAPGAAALALALADGRGWAFLATPGAVASATGLVLLYQATTGRWSSWAYAWALVGPAATGLGLVVHGRAAGRHGVVAVGTWLAGAGLAAFALLGLFFETLPDRPGGGGAPLARAAAPLLLIGAGVFLYLRRRSAGGRQDGGG